MTKVKLEQGTLVGGKAITPNGFEYHEFIQIPYAKPPVGELRFQSPQPLASWSGELDVTTCDPDRISFQFDLVSRSPRGSEDCLYLNVYSPKLNPCRPKPVLFFIHGGAFVYNNGTIKGDCGPDYLIEHDVVVVTINYRLGILGFLSLDIPEAAGNMGLKDQVMALKWVQKNIHKFGGDPKNVTVFGVSAGACSIEYLILSPVAKGLFSKAIIQSGSALMHATLNDDLKNLSIRVAQELGYQGSANDCRAICEFLRQQPAALLAGAAAKLANPMVGKRLYFGFVPTIEKDFGNGEALLTEYPYKLLKEGRFNPVPILRGFCEREGFLMFGSNRENFQELVQSKRFLDFWSYQMDPADAEEYSSRFTEAYLRSDTDGGDTFAINFFSDYDFVNCIFISTEFMVKKGVPVHFYKFSYDGNLSVLKKLMQINKPGAMHADDLPYTMRMVTPIPVHADEYDLMTIKRISKMWTDFAKTSDPTPKSNEVTPLPWPAYDNDNQRYLVIDKDLQIAAKYHPERIAIFKEIYEKYNK